MRPLPALAEIDRLLVVKTSSIGDVIHALPVVQALKEAKPDLRLDWVVRRRCAEVLQGNPAIDQLFVIENKPSLQELHALKSRFYERQYQCALDMQGLALSGLLTWLSGAPITIGWDRNREANSFFLTHPIVPGKPQRIGIQHEIDLLYGFACVLGVCVPHPEFTPQPYLASEGRTQAEVWLREIPRPRIILNVGASRAYKRWPIEHWCALANLLLAQGIGLVLIGDKNDAQHTAEITQKLGPQERLLDLAGKTALHQLASVLADCDLVVSADTGPMHLAVAVGTSVVALFGGTDPARHGPYGTHQRVLRGDAPEMPKPKGGRPVGSIWAGMYAGNHPRDGFCCSSDAAADLKIMPKKILVVNMNFMGDALLTTPALAALRHAYPDAQIDTVVGKGAAAEVLQDNPDLDAVIARTAQDSWSRCTQIYSLLREGRYTDAIILPPLAAYAAAAWLARTPVRIGQANRDMDRFLTHRQRVQSTHMADMMLETLPISPEARSQRRRLNVTVGRVHMEKASQMLASAGIDLKRPLIGVNLGATRPQKRWFVESFAAVLDAMPDIQVVLVGSGAEDVKRALEVRQLSQKTTPANLVGRTSVKELAAVLAQCDLVVSADSGPMHLATAVGVPTVALFGSTDPMATGPYDTVSRVLYKDLACAPCGNHPTCHGRYDCLRAITPEEVALSVRSLLRERRSTGSVPLTMTSVSSMTQAPLAGALEPPASSGILPLHKEGLARNISTDRASADKIRRILIVTKFRFIGDTLLAIPIFRAARAQWPEARIVLLTGKNASALLEHNPYLDEIIEFDPYKANYGMRPYVSLIRRLRQGRFDLCLALNRSFHSALTPWLSRVKIRAGFRSEGRGPLLNRRVEYDREKSEIACYFDVLHAAAPGMPVNPTLELWGQ